MDKLTRELRESHLKMEGDEAKRRAMDKARLDGDRANLGVLKSQKKGELAQIDRRLASLGEGAGGNEKVLAEIWKEIRALRKVAMENGKLLRALVRRG